MKVDFKQDIYDLNLHYLLVLQRVAQSDGGEAVLRFGVDAKTIAIVRDASIRELQTMASSVVAMMAPRELLQEIVSPDHADRAGRARAGAILRSISTTVP